MHIDMLTKSLEPANANWTLQNAMDAATALDAVKASLTEAVEEQNGGKLRIAYYGKPSKATPSAGGAAAAAELGVNAMSIGDAISKQDLLDFGKVIKSEVRNESQALIQSAMTAVKTEIATEFKDILKTALEPLERKMDG